MLRNLKHRIFKKSKFASHLDLIDSPSISEVADYFEKETPKYLNTYGNIIQAARPGSDRDFLDYLTNSMDMRDGMRIIDGGCGVCGPAIYFAERFNVRIDAIAATASEIAIAEQNIAEAKLNGGINLTVGDICNLNRTYSANEYDLVYFLEVLGYANSLTAVLEGALKVLKPGGSVYVKDFFPVPLVRKNEREIQLQILREIRNEYRYRVLDLLNLLDISRQLGFFLEYVRRPDFIEDFTKASRFEAESPHHQCYTKAITNPFQLFEAMELKLQKPA